MVAVYSIKPFPFLPPFPPPVIANPVSMLPTPAEIGGRINDVVGLIPIIGDILEVIEILYPRHIIDKVERATMDTVSDFFVP